MYILKADGGTIPLELARNMPIEAVFTGPAASVLGIMAQGTPKEPAISLDIGGTTTDIALWLEGIPLTEKDGAEINSYATSVKAFWLKSIGIGGDSAVSRKNGELIVGGAMRYLTCGCIRRGCAYHN